MKEQHRNALCCSTFFHIYRMRWIRWDLVYGKGIEEDAPEAYLQESRREVDVFDAAYAWTAQAVDEIILPADTRRVVIEALTLTRDKREELPRRAKPHGAPPT